MAAGTKFLKGLMDNPNFQKWFGESVVRDAEGLPLEVYHGTRREFTEFDPAKNGTAHDSGFHGDGFYFAKTGGHASDYAGTLDGASVIPGFVSLQNPYIRPSRRKYGSEAHSIFQSDMERMGGLSAKAQEDPQAYAKELTELLKKNGHDGLVLDTGKPDVDEIVAFDPTQFKSRFNAGTFDPSDPNFLKSAGLMTAGAGAAAYGMSPDDAEASYIGPKGLANLLGPDAAKKLLTDAEQMAAKGVDNEAVRQATGLFQGMDGKWRFEVDDSGAGLMPDAIKGLRTKNGLPQSRVTSHNELFSAYPELADTWTVAGGPVGSGEYHSGIPGKSNMMVLGVGKRGAVNEPEIKNTLLHELQHAIQQREGFARGGSPSEFTQVDDAKLARDALTFRRELDKIPGGMDSLAKENAIVKDYQDMDAMDFLPSREARDLAHDRDYNPDDQLTELVKAYGLDKHVDMTPKRAYDWLAGEIEARDTAARMNLTPEQRKATPPDLRDNAIVRFDGGQSASVPQRREWAKDAGSNTPNVAQSMPLNQQDVSDNNFWETALGGARAIGKEIDSASKYLGPLVMNAPSRFISATAKDPVGMASNIADFIVPFKSSARDYADAFYHNQDATWLDKINALAGIGLDAAFFGHGNQAKNIAMGLMR